MRHYNLAMNPKTVAYMMGTLMPWNHTIEYHPKMKVYQSLLMNENVALLDAYLSHQNGYGADMMKLIIELIIGLGAKDYTDEMINQEDELSEAVRAGEIKESEYKMYIDMAQVIKKIIEWSDKSPNLKYHLVYEYVFNAEHKEKMISISVFMD